MARAAHLFGQIARMHRRGGVVVPEDVVLAMAIGANGRIEVAPAQRHGMDAEIVFGGLRLVATGTGLRQARLVDARDPTTMDWFISWLPWQSMQLADSTMPRWSAAPCTLLSKEDTKWVPRTDLPEISGFETWHASQSFACASFNAPFGLLPRGLTIAWR